MRTVPLRRDVRLAARAELRSSVPRRRARRLAFRGDNVARARHARQLRAQSCVRSTLAPHADARGCESALTLLMKPLKHALRRCAATGRCRPATKSSAKLNTLSSRARESDRRVARARAHDAARRQCCGCLRTTARRLLSRHRGLALTRSAFARELRHTRAERARPRFGCGRRHSLRCAAARDGGCAELLLLQLLRPNSGSPSRWRRRRGRVDGSSRRSANRRRATRTHRRADKRGDVTSGSGGGGLPRRRIN